MGGIGLCYGQGTIMMWPEWSAWTWYAVGTALIPLLWLPNAWEKRDRILMFFGIVQKADTMTLQMKRAVAWSGDMPAKPPWYRPFKRLRWKNSYGGLRRDEGGPGG